MLTKAIDHANREISLVREYRARLIFDFITGKLDVRKAAASLLDQPDLLEMLVDDVIDEADEVVAETQGEIAEEVA